VGNVQLSANQLAGYAQNAGFTGTAITTAVAIALAESGGNTWAIDNDSNGSQDQGLWQINTVHAAAYPGMVRDPSGSSRATSGTSVMFDPATNARAAFGISSGGTNFGPWSTYTSGAYRAHLDAASAGALSPSTTAAGSLTPGASLPGTSLNALTPTQQALIAKVGTGTIPTVSSGSVADPAIAGRTDQWFNNAAGPDLADRVTTQSTVELTTAMLSQFALTCVDPDLSIYTSLAPFVDPTGDTAQLAGQFIAFDNELLVLNEIQTTDLTGVPGTILTMSSACLNWMSTQRNRDIVSGVTASQWIRLKVAEFNTQLPNGVSPVKVLAQDQNMLTYGSIAMNASLDVTQWQSYFDEAQQLCQNEGAWLFEVGGTVVFARPEWLLDKVPQFTVLWPGLNPPASLPANVMTACLETPVFLRSQQLFTGDTCVLQLDHHTGEQVRPGQEIILTGCGAGNTNMSTPSLGGGTREYRWLVTQVQWNYDGFATPVQVTLNEALNPVPAAPGGRQPVSPTTDPTGNPGGDPTYTGVGTGLGAHGPQTVSAFIAELLTQVNKGKKYIYGAVDFSNGAPIGNPTAFDCSSLVQWALYNVGITSCPRTSGQQYAWAVAARTTCTIAKAIATPGALVFLGANGSEHVAVSQGGGMFIEAENPTNGIVSNYDNSQWSVACLVPGLVYPGSGS
jgi:cell wall-associated NlpC family hydrolase